MKREIIYTIEGQPLTCGRPSTCSEYLRARGYSRHLMTYLRHHENTLFVNGQPAFTNRPLQAGDVLRAVFTDEPDPGSAHIIPSPMALDIVYEDEDILVINKPPYLPVQPSLGHREHTLGNGVAAYFEAQGIPFIYRCVNRIDKNTSGLVLIARNMASSAILYDAMKKREIHRTYFALVHGKPDINHPVTCPGFEDFPGLIDLPIARKEGSTIERMVDRTRGRRAVTHYRILSYSPGTDTSALLVRLETGRTHQIRVHMSAIGHPIVGDGMYGFEKDLTDRQALHSVFLDLSHPITGKALHFEAALPADIRSLLPDNCKFTLVK